MRILVCSTDVPHLRAHPRLSASMLILFQYVTHLKKSDHKILHLIALDAAADRTELLRQYEDEMRSAGSFDILLWRPPSLLKPRSSSLARMEAVDLDPSVKAAIEEFRPDVIFCFDCMSAALLQHVEIAPKVVQVHDPKFLVLWFHALYALREQPLSQLPRMPLELIRAQQWKSLYRRALKKCHTVLSAVGSSVPVFRSMAIPARYLPFPWPAFPPQALPNDKPATPTFLFLGNLAGLGSRSALNFLFFKLYPVLTKQWGKNGFRILICGTNTAAQWIRSAIDARPELEFRGFVEEIESLMLSCHAVIVPVDVKTGNRTRIITAMSLGVLTIAHSNTALGNPALVDGETCYLAATPEAFAKRMQRTMERPEEVKRITTNAKKIYNEQFAPDVASERMAQELQAAAG